MNTDSRATILRKQARDAERTADVALDMGYAGTASRCMALALRLREKAAELAQDDIEGEVVAT